MRIIFSRRRTLPSWLIRVACWSRWSHVSIQADDALVIDARFWGGVRYRSRDELVDRASAHEVVDVPLPDEAAAMEWLHQQVGKGYDWSAVLGIVCRAGAWADPSRWFCSELEAAAEAAGGLRRWREDASRITPEHVWMVRT